MTLETLGEGRYELESKLGAGGMALVYRAHDHELDRPVAIKVLAEHVSGDPDVRERFLREAKLAARLSHPNVVNVFHQGEEGGRPYIVMEYVEGSTLAEEVKRRGRLPYAEAVELVIQACAGLEHAHANDLIHRDIKPQNLLLRGDGTLKVADFGIARAAEGTQLTQAGTVLGTAAYVSPEQAAGAPVTHAADIYSLGAVLYELVAGRPPHTFETFQELAFKHQQGHIDNLRSSTPDVPRGLDEIVLRCLAREPAARPSSAAELAQQLATLTPEPLTVPLPQGEVTRPTIPGLPPRRRITRGRLLAYAAAVALLLFLAAPVLRGQNNSSGTTQTQPADPVRPSTNPAERARNLADWIRAHSARPSGG